MDKLNKKLIFIPVVVFIIFGFSLIPYNFVESVSPDGYGWDYNLTKRCVKSPHPDQDNYYEDTTECEAGGNNWQVAVQSEGSIDASCPGPRNQSFLINGPDSPVTMNWVEHTDEFGNPNWLVDLKTNFNDNTHPCGDGNFTWFVLQNKHKAGDIILPRPDRAILEATVWYNDFLPNGAGRVFAGWSGRWNNKTFAIEVAFSATNWGDAHEDEDIIAIMSGLTYEGQGGFGLDTFVLMDGTNMGLGITKEENNDVQVNFGEIVLDLVSRGILPAPTDGWQNSITTGVELGTEAHNWGETSSVITHLRFTNVRIKDAYAILGDVFDPEGYLSTVTCDYIGGWAVDWDTPNDQLGIRVYADGPAGTGTLIKDMETIVSREDVNSLYDIEGNHGYSMSFPDSLKDGQPHSIYVQAVDTSLRGINPLLRQTPKTITCEAVSTVIDDYDPIGWHGFATCEEIKGWAIDEDTPGDSINVHIYKDGPAGNGGTMIANITANISRPDVNEVVGVTGNHGFSLPPPESLIDGEPHDIYVYGIDSSGEGINTLLSNSPRTLTCEPPTTSTPPPMPVGYGWDYNLTKRCVKSPHPDQENYYEDTTECEAGGDEWLVAVQSEGGIDESCPGPRNQSFLINGPNSPITMNWVEHTDEFGNPNWSVNLKTDFNTKTHPCVKENGNYTWYIIRDSYKGGEKLLPRPDQAMLEATVWYNDFLPNGAGRMFVGWGGMWDDKAFVIEVALSITGWRGDAHEDEDILNLMSGLTYEGEGGGVLDIFVAMDGTKMGLGITKGENNNIQVNFGEIIQDLVSRGIFPAPTDGWQNSLTSFVEIGTEPHNWSETGSLVTDLWVTNFRVKNALATPGNKFAPEGWLNDPSCDAIWGWAIDRDTPNSEMDVHIYMDGAFGNGGTFVDSVRTTQLRSGVNDLYGSSGNHGFSVPFPEQFKDGQSHTVYVHAIDTSTGSLNPLIRQSPKTVTCEPSTEPPITSTDEYDPIGYHDLATCEEIKGWAVDEDTPGDSINVHIYKDGPAGNGGTMIANITANISRPDVNEVVGVTGNHGFSLPPPESLIDGEPHDIYVYGIDSSGEGINTLLSESPKTLTCEASTELPTEPPPSTSDEYDPIGYHDLATCEEIKGWAIDEDTPNDSINIHIYDGQAGSGGTMIANITTDIYRLGVNEFVGVTGNHGFSLIPPESLLDGSSHPLYVYAIDSSGEGINTLLSESPRTLTCEASTELPTEPPPSTSDEYDPIGYHDLATCEEIKGWAVDEDTPNDSINVHIYDGQAGSGGTMIANITANISRPDVNEVIGVTGNHGFSLPPPESLIDGEPHDIYVYGIDSSGEGINTLLSESPKELDTTSCVPTTQICEHPAPAEGCSWVGEDIYPECGAELVCGIPTPTMLLEINGQNSSTKRQLEVFNFSGVFSPNSDILRYVKSPNSDKFVKLSPDLKSDSSGKISWLYVPLCQVPTGIYQVRAVDSISNKTSNIVYENITSNPSCDTNPETYELKEGDLVSAIFSDDPDVYIINEYGYKRLFLNPEIFKFYAHLGGFFNVKVVTPEVRDSFGTSVYFRNCEINDEKVYGVETTGEDIGILHWINIDGDRAVQEDPEFFKKIFCINNNEFNWYTNNGTFFGTPYTALRQVPAYSR